MAAKVTICQCTVADSDALTRNNIPAFWADPHWVLAWKHRTLEYHMAQIAKRMPRNLLNDREIKRHQKAVHAGTGRLVGYARWILPESHATLADGTPAWPEAVVPAVSAEEEAEIRRVAATAHWDPNEESDDLTKHIQDAKKGILARKEYIRLDYLAVHPDNQGRGIGTALVQSGMEQAEKLGLDIFVYAKEQGAGVYKRLGFRVERDFVLDDSEYGGTGRVYVALMIYEQKPRSDGEVIIGQGSAV